MKYERQLPKDSIGIVSDFEKMRVFHNYEKKLQKLGLEGKIRYGELSILAIGHDDWCDIYNKDRCNCEPIIQNRLTGEIIG